MPDLGYSKTNSPKTELSRETMLTLVLVERVVVAVVTLASVVFVVVPINPIVVVV